MEASGERAVEVHGDAHQVATGDFVTQIERATVLPAEALAHGPTAEPVRYLPERTAHFVGRRRELALLDEAFADPGGVVVHAVHGLGGIGKSTLAAHWVARRTADFNPVWWITAESPADLDAGLAALGRALQPTLVGVVPEEALRERTLQWLAAHDGWLIVLDNVRDPADVEPLLARARNGRFLITTRRSATSWRRLGRSLDLDVLQLAEAVELFTHIHAEPADGVDELCTELGCLPLAIDQAAAYCREAGITPRTYLGLLARHPAAVYAASAEGGDAERTVARVWRVTLDRLGDTPAAGWIVRVMAWWAPEGIPRRYVVAPDSLEGTEALRRLAAHSLITLHGDGTISVHRLVQAVARTPDPEDPHRSTGLINQARDAAVLALYDVSEPFLDDGPERIELLGGADSRVWATHVEALASKYLAKEDTAETADLFGLAGMRLAADFETRRALKLCERSLSAALRACGPDDSITRQARSDLATVCDFAGDTARALALRTEVLTDCERLLRPDHPDTIEARRALSETLAETGDHRRARTLARENVQVAERALGMDHPATRAARQASLPALAAGLPSELGDVFLDAMRTAERTLDVIRSRDPLEKAELLMEAAFSRHEAGDHEEAVFLAEGAVERLRRLCGDTGGMTLVARAQHAVLLRIAGDPERAAALFAAILAEAEQALGDTEFTRQLRGWFTPFLPHRRPDLTGDG